MFGGGVGGGGSAAAGKSAYQSALDNGFVGTEAAWLLSLHGQDGISAPTGPTKAEELMLFGSGADGDLSISSGVTTIQRDMYYRNVTLSGTARLNTGGFRVFVSDTLNLSNAPASAISNQAGDSNQALAASTAAPSYGGSPGQGTTVASADSPQAPGIGATGVGVQAAAGSSLFPSSGGASGGNGAGGASGTGNAGGARRTGRTIVSAASPRHIDLTGTLGASGKYYAGQGGIGGSSGGGDGTNSSNAGAPGSAGGGNIILTAKKIIRGAGTAALAINAKAGKAARYTSAQAAGNIGGYGGGGGGGGGFVFLVYATLEGAPVVDLICVDGGDGSPGGNGVGTGIGGQGGQGGACGRIILANVTAGTLDEAVTPSAIAAVAAAPATIAGSAGTTGVLGRATL
jgi:hypothetical protein